jgi:hypothetical protein
MDWRRDVEETCGKGEDSLTRGWGGGGRRNKLGMEKRREFRQSFFVASFLEGGRGILSL